MRIVYPLRGIVQAGRRAALDVHRRTAIYVGVLITLAIAAAAALIVSGHTLVAPIAVIALGVTAAIAERSSVYVTRAIELSISVLPTLIAAVLFGPLAAGVVGAASMLGDPELISHGSPERAPRLKWASYTSTRFLGGAAMGIAAQSVLDAVPSTLGGLITATLVGALIGELLEAAFSILAGVVRGWGVVETAALHKPLLAHLILIVAPVYAPVVALLAYMYLTFSPWTLALFLVPAIAAQRLYGLYQEQRRLADDLSVANETLERANLQFAGALIATLDARDRYTAGHSAAVAIYSRDIAKRMELSPETQELAYLCGLVHDIGKIGLSPGLLEKPGALTLDERRQMQEHSAIGERILAHVDEYSEIARIVRHHHERIDGQGYPDGLASEEIPLVSRLIAVADAYNAMTSDRPYRDAMPSRVARLRLAQAVDSQFDTAAVAAFEAILAGADEDYRLAIRSDFKAFAQSTYDEVSATEPRVAVA
jgi:putative nucleotidyltransferase with HDIG domain